MSQSPSILETSSQEASSILPRTASNRGIQSKEPSEDIRQQRLDHHVQSNLAQYGRTDKIVFVDPEKVRSELPHKHESPSKFHMFFHRYNFTEFARRPVLHQWLQDGKVYRGANERVSSRFELFFDLLFVGIIHQLAESTTEHPNGLGLAKFILTFCPAFSIWIDVRDLGNQFGNDDVTQRLYILWTMILLVGFSNNASTIELVPISQPLSDTSRMAARWTMGYIFVAKLSIVLLHVIYAFFLPLSSKPLLVRACNELVFALFFFAGIFVPGHVLFILIPLAIFFEYASKFLGVLFIKWLELRPSSQQSTRTNTEAWSERTILVQEGSQQTQLVVEGPRRSELDSQQAEVIVDGLHQTELERARKVYRLPAVNIEHHIDRMNAFITIILGEMVVNIFYQTGSANALDARCGRSILGLMVAFNLNWIYFDSEACRCFVHALRRHWITGLLFAALHLPLSLALLLASAAMKRLVMGGSVPSSAVHAAVTTTPGRASKVPSGITWFFGAGLGLSLISMASIGLLHRSMDRDRSGGVFRLTRSVVIGARFVIGVLMVLLPLEHEKLGPTKILAIYAGLTSFLIIKQTFSKLERVEREQSELIKTAQEVVE